MTMLTPNVMISRDGFDRSPVNFMFFARKTDGSGPTQVNEIGLFTSPDGVRFSQRKLFGDIARWGKGTLSSSLNAENIVRVGNSLIWTANHMSNDGVGTELIFKSRYGWDWKQVHFKPVSGNNFFGLAAKGNAVCAVRRDGTNLVSTDAGETWVEGIPVGNTVSGLAANSQAFVAVGPGGSLKSASDPSAGWTTRTSQFGSSEIAAIQASETEFIAVGRDNKISTGTPNGQTWTARSSPLAGTSILTFIFKAGSRWFAGSNSDPEWISSTNGGASWAIHASKYWLPGGAHGRVLHPIIGPSRSILLYLGGTGFSYSTDNNVWQTLADPGVDFDANGYSILTTGIYFEPTA